MIVIAIIGILASIVLVSLSSAREKANIATFKSQVSSLQPNILAMCDTATLAFGNIEAAAATTGANRKTGTVAAANITSNLCGPSGTGAFTVTIRSINLGTSAAAVACNTVDTTMNQNGVLFATGC